MDKQIITLCYRKIIEAGCTQPWDKLVFDDSYAEYLIQAQLLSKDTLYTTYGELISHIPAAKNLSGMVTPAIVGYVQQLNHITPGVLNNLGRRFLKFNRFEFELINSSIKDRSRHQVAVNFYSEPLVWYSTIHNYMLVAPVQSISAGSNNNEVFTHLFELQPYLSIHSIKNFQP